jgi:hypothetical protein
VLEPSANSPTNNGVGPFRGRPRSKAAPKAKKQDQQLDQLLERQWSELPYAMMRITAARRPWDGNRVYWRDRTVQLGGVELNLARTRAQADASSYKATYALDELRRKFPLHPSLEDDQLRWSAPGISEVNLTTDQLAEKLLAKLVAFYTTGLPKSATSPASPGPSS